MRCTNCDYPLWNLTGNSCPECGTGFTASDHEFKANAVRFCCPYCDQTYYGTDQHGHLVPPEFVCVSCDNAITMDECVLRPAEGVAAEEAGRDEMPWFNRQRIGPVRAWFRTVGMAMGTPARLMRSIPIEDMGARRWSYALVTMLIILGTGAVLPLLLVGLLGAIFGGTNSVDQLLASLYFLVGGIVVYAVIIIMWGLTTHGVLLVTGGARHPIGRTFDALCYSIGANITTAVPCIGIYPFLFVGWCWWVVSATLMTAEAHQIRGGRASLATLAFPVIIIVLFIVSVVGAVFWGVNQVQMAMGPNRDETQIVLDRLVAYAADNSSTGPSHALALVEEGDDVNSGFGIHDFVATSSETFVEDVPVAGGETLSSFDEQFGPQRQATLDAAIAALPEDVAAHRLGDWVFTYHGVPFTEKNGERWAVIASADPDQGGTPTIFIHSIGKVDGSVEGIGADQFQERLDKENAVRQGQGYPEIPLPEDVTHDAPATHGDGP